MAELDSIILVIGTLAGTVLGYWISLGVESKRQKHEKEMDYRKMLLSHTDDLIKPLLARAIILKSSENCYHVVFDRAVSWSENMSAVAWVALQSHNKGLNKWFLMQCIKGCSTLRVSFKREKPSPRIVFRLGKQEKQVKEFIKTRRIIKKIV